MNDRRAELLDGATAWVFEHGLATLSLRPLAKALGTSDRMLIYWFGSRDGLLAAIAEHAGEGLSLALPVVDPDAPPPSPREWLDQCWALFSDPLVRPGLALLFELDALGARAPDRPGTQPGGRRTGGLRSSTAPSRPWACRPRGAGP